MPDNKSIAPGSTVSRFSLILQIERRIRARFREHTAAIEVLHHLGILDLGAPSNMYGRQQRPGCLPGSFRQRGTSGG